VISHAKGSLRASNPEPAFGKNLEGPGRAFVKQMPIDEEQRLAIIGALMHCMRRPELVVKR
jgi:hypothetical protein